MAQGINYWLKLIYDNFQTKITTGINATGLTQSIANIEDSSDSTAANTENIVGNDTSTSSSQTRPDNTTAYAVGDVVGTDPAANMSFSNVSKVAGGGVIICGASLEIDVNSVPANISGFRLHLYNAAPTPIADNAAYNLPSADRTKYLGYVEFSNPIYLGDTLWTEVNNVNKKIKLATSSTTLYGILETRGAFTPSAQIVKKVTLNTVGV